MNKNEFVGAVAAKANISQAAAKESIDAVIAVIGETLKQNEDVALVGFGTFRAKSCAARKGINPATGAAIDIPAKKAVAFKAGKTLLENIK